MKSLEELLTSFSNLSAEQLPDVIIVNGLNEYQESVNAFFFSKTFSMLLEATDYVGQKKQSTALLYVRYKVSLKYQGKLINFLLN